jgi:hypothetical protein
VRARSLPSQVGHQLLFQVACCWGRAGAPCWACALQRPASQQPRQQPRQPWPSRQPEPGAGPTSTSCQRASLSAPRPSTSTAQAGGVLDAAAHGAAGPGDDRHELPHLCRGHAHLHHAVQGLRHPHLHHGWGALGEGGGAGAGAADWAAGRGGTGWVGGWVGEGVAAPAQLVCRAQMRSRPAARPPLCAKQAACVHRTQATGQARPQAKHDFALHLAQRRASRTPVTSTARCGLTATCSRCAVGGWVGGWGGGDAAASAAGCSWPALRLAALPFPTL